MKPKDLSSLSKILGSIHQPLPLNQKESQRLLDKITTSFRKHLDEEHPGFTPETGGTVKPSVSPATASRPQPAPTPARTRPTDHHVQSILSNPLFSYGPPSTNAVAGSAIREDANRTSDRGPALQAGRDPMDVFDEAVARGMMTPMRAAGCLMAKRREIVQSASPSVRDAMAKSGAGLKVVGWLRASGQQRELKFLKYPRLVDELVPFLMAEHQEEVVWSWLAALVQDEQLETTTFCRKHANGLLMRMLDFHSDNSPSMNDAYNCLMRAQRSLPQSWLISPSRPTAEEPGREDDLLLVSWHKLNWKSTVLAWQHPSKPSRRLFDQFSNIGHRYLDPTNTVNQLELAHLALHHPAEPRYGLAMKMLNAPTTWSEWYSEQSRNPGQLIPSTVRLRSLGMDVTQYFVKHGETDRAKSMFQIIEEKLQGTLAYHSWEIRMPAGA
ncbi:hypothetical protein RB594_003166 [Gaeumannomyces avenae]